MLIFSRIIALRTAARAREGERAAKERDRVHSLAHSDPLTGLLSTGAGSTTRCRWHLAKTSSERILALHARPRRPEARQRQVRP
jgi:hypothetical protein